MLGAPTHGKLLFCGLCAMAAIAAAFAILSFFA